MRLRLVLAGVLALIAGSIVFMFRSYNSLTWTSMATTDENNQQGDTDNRDASFLPAPDAEALAALREELSRAEPVAYRSDKQRLAEARAWVEANRDPDRPYNDIEAKILALMDVLIDSDKRSAEWVMNMSQIEIEMIRAIDADSDGQVSDEEVQQFIDDRIASMFNPIEHPYLQNKLDTDGDGTVSPEEMAGLASVMSDGALSGVFERARLEAWDTDSDGFISETERVAGEQAAMADVEEMFASFVPEPDLSDMPEEQREAAKAAIAEQMEAMKEQLQATKDMMVSQAVSQELLEAMRLDNLEAPDQAEMMQDMPKPPDPNSFDLDSDGTMSDSEIAAQQVAMQEYQKEVERWGAELAAYRLKEQFENATAQNDADGDGRMSADEWEARIDDLLLERERRLFRRSYDLDSSGRVDANELTTFIDWYRQGSLRADFNYDGKVNGLDLEQMARAFQTQGN